jgi:hypothetical protein
MTRPFLTTSMASMRIETLRGAPDVYLRLLRGVINAFIVGLAAVSGHNVWSQTTGTFKIVDDRKHSLGDRPC